MTQINVLAMGWSDLHTHKYGILENGRISYRDQMFHAERNIKLPLCVSVCEQVREGGRGGIEREWGLTNSFCVAANTSFLRGKNANCAFCVTVSLLLSNIL
jgi:hypothetical protein